ncbi:hypothetical protein FPZ12_043165 [Amycolatopsis acidicola]|uniref:Type II secretion system protein GspF domain-containing protein n=1 Tax=Amycolatopsis acidicola TaxID=2596893 RepID=A0A5N0UN99_9PSEU|nr:hypothetical protein [Amycolatopsis acidicola]KAA9149488.1 hypothetical protein FPZ12_043165 [Amycolatopsis acidicola]
MLSATLACVAAALLCWPVRQGLARFSALFSQGEKRNWRPPTNWMPVAGLLALLPLAGPAGAVAVGLLGAAWWRRRAARRRTKAEVAAGRALAEALYAMVSELRGGAAPAAAAVSAGADAPREVADLMRMLASAATFGDEVRIPAGSGPFALWQGQVAQAWSLSRRHGLPLAELLEAVRRDVIARTRFTARVEASMAGPRASAAVLAALPLLGLLLGEAMGAHPIHVLTGTNAGQVLLLLGAALILTGTAWSARLTRVTRD